MPAYVLESPSTMCLDLTQSQVMVPPQGSKTSQGYELQLGTNNLGHFLFVQYLRPILTATARQAMKDSVRVIWVSSSAVGLAPKPPIDFSNMDYGKDESAWIKYGRSKAGTVLYAVELARRAKEAREGVLSLVSASLVLSNYYFLYYRIQNWKGSEFPEASQELALINLYLTEFESGKSEERSSKAYV